MEIFFNEDKLYAKVVGVFPVTVFAIVETTSKIQVKYVLCNASSQLISVDQIFFPYD